MNLKNDNVTVFSVVPDILVEHTMDALTYVFLDKHVLLIFTNRATHSVKLITIEDNADAFGSYRGNLKQKFSSFLKFVNRHEFK